MLLSQQLTCEGEWETKQVGGPRPGVSWPTENQWRWVSPALPWVLCPGVACPRRSNIKLRLSNLNSSPPFSAMPAGTIHLQFKIQEPPFAFRERRKAFENMNPRTDSNYQHWTLHFGFQFKPQWGLCKSSYPCNLKIRNVHHSWFIVMAFIYLRQICWPSSFRTFFIWKNEEYRPLSNHGKIRTWGFRSKMAPELHTLGRWLDYRGLGLMCFLPQRSQLRTKNMSQNKPFFL